MHVERCPSCGARYNVTRLASGTRFSCRRCGAVVCVGALDGAPGEPTRRLGLTALGVTGLALVVLRGLLSTGPWMAPARGAIPTLLAGLTVAEVTALGVAALACTFTALAGLSARPFLLGAAATTLFWVVARSHGSEAPVLGVPAPDPGVFLALALLAASALLLGGPPRGGRATGRAWALVGACLLAATAAERVVEGQDGAQTVLASWTRDVTTFWRDVVWRGLPAHEGAAPWAHELPLTARAFAAGLLLLAAALPPVRAAGLVRSLARIALLLLLLAMLAPPLAAAWGMRDELLGTEGVPRSLRLVAEAAWDDGILLWLLASLLLAAFAAERGAARRARPAEPRPRSTPRHLALAAAALAALLLLENPGSGVLAAHWPWEGWARDATSVASVAAGLLAALVAAAAIATLAPPLRRGGTLVAAGAALATGAFGLSASLADVPRIVIPCVVSTGAGLLWAQRGTPWSTGGRVASASLGVALGGLLLWPQSSALIAQGVEAQSWPCLAATLVAGAQAFRDPAGSTLNLRFDVTTSTALVTGLAALVLWIAAATGPRRGLAEIALVLAAAAALHPLVQAFAQSISLRSPGGSPFLGDALEAANRALRVHPAPLMIATFVVAAGASAGPGAGPLPR